MKQIVLQKGKPTVADLAEPVCGPHEILVKVLFSFVSSGTELATINASKTSLLSKAINNVAQSAHKLSGAIKEHGVGGTVALVKEKMHTVMPIGYSCSGQVIGVGSKIENFMVGDYVACAGAGFASHAQIVSVPENLACKVSDSTTLRQASITTIGAIALQGIRRANLQLGQKVCVIGLGLLGQLTAQLAQQAGCDVIGVDIQQARLEQASQLGIGRTINSSTHDLAKEIAWATNHHGVDCTIITASAPFGSIIDNAMHITRRKGTVVLVGDVKLDFDREQFYTKEIDFLISCSYGPGRYDPSYELESNDYPYAYVRWTENRNMQLIVSMIEREKLKIDPLISGQYTLDSVEKAYQSLNENNALGIVFEYPNDFIPAHKTTACTQGKPRIYVAPPSTLNVACVGVGGFAKTKLLPLLASMPKTSIQAIVDVNSTHALTMKNVYNAAYTDNDIARIIADEQIHAVVIATPHYLHTQQALRLLGAGKAVFVEKPAAVNQEQLVALESFFQTTLDAPYCVDFNRSYAPFMQTVKQELATRSNPLMLYYRMNVNFLPKTHWIQSEQNRGNIIGEACHIFDLFNFLTDARPKTVSVQITQPRGNSIAITDNVSATVHMSDGSCCTLIYTCLGNSSAGKEYMELYFDGKTIIMNDFVKLSGFGTSRSCNTSAIRADKGHKQLLQAFFTTAHTWPAPLPIPIERILDTTRVSLAVDQLARQGGGTITFETESL
ncbi:MAG: bi-domain-containing oxidoreductase [Epsilonproteobacteria bacterium]|nr:bi-domain-containing oxidoreductase [Campylobacterota bacterium]